MIGYILLLLLLSVWLDVQPCYLLPPINSNYLPRQIRSHTHTQVFSFYVICLWHNCRSVSLVPPSQPQCGTEACWHNQSCGYQPYELSYLWLWSQRFCCFVYHINSDWRGLRSFWDLAGNLESQLESWILVQTKTLKWSWVFREEVPFYKAVLLG